jgi:polysaccharide pyruvyl transferase CsaB
MQQSHKIMKITLSGYYGFGNAGDELLLGRIINDIRTVIPEAEITVFSQTPQKTADVHGVKAVDRWSPVAVVTAIARTDILISGGGGLFQDSTGSTSLYYYLAIIALSSLLRKKIVVYGVGVSNLRRINSMLAARILGCADAITVRDEQSKQLLASWGISKEKVTVTSDPVLSYESKFKKCSTGRPRIAFVLRPARNGVCPVEQFKFLANTLNRRLNAEILFIPFHPASDLAFTRAVMNRMDVSSSLVTWERPEELYEVFSKIDLLISQRFHALILASLCGVPLLGISNFSKIVRFLHETGQQNIPDAGCVDSETLVDVTLKIWENRETVAAPVTEKIEVLREMAKENRRVLREVVLKCQKRD